MAIPIVYRFAQVRASCNWLAGFSRGRSAMVAARPCSHRRSSHSCMIMTWSSQCHYFKKCLNFFFIFPFYFFQFPPRILTLFWLISPIGSDDLGLNAVISGNHAQEAIKEQIGDLCLWPQALEVAVLDGFRWRACKTSGGLALTIFRLRVPTGGGTNGSARKLKKKKSTF